jgi:hypothetical protein
VGGGVVGVKVAAHLKKDGVEARIRAVLKNAADVVGIRPAPPGDPDAAHLRLRQRNVGVGVGIGIGIGVGVGVRIAVGIRIGIGTIRFGTALFHQRFFGDTGEQEHHLLTLT